MKIKTMLRISAWGIVISHMELAWFFYHNNRELIFWLLLGNIVGLIIAYAFFESEIIKKIDE